MVTSVPYEFHTVANSAPIAPLPTMITLAGRDLLQDRFPVSHHAFAVQIEGARCDGVRASGDDDVPCIERNHALSPLTSTVLCEVKRAPPMWTSILFFFIKKPTPW